MTVFNEYARYYDLLYKDKDYAGESEYVHGLIQSHAPGARNILNMGCGSGLHDRSLVKLNYTVTGVDLSDKMLTVAQQNAVGSNDLEYHHGDIRSIKLHKTFDAVISLFHVMSYQVTNDDLISAFNTARLHLKTGGVFLFDCWYGPAVFTDLPAARFKEIEDDKLRVVRFASPSMCPNSDVVEVAYRIFVEMKPDGVMHQFNETHSMRYFFIPELELICRQTGFSLSKTFGWLTFTEPSMDTWYSCMVCTAI